MLSNGSGLFGKKRSAASNPPFSLALAKSPNSHLENGHPARYSGRMSTYCATAAPTRHPPVEAPSPSVTALVATFDSGPLPVNRASEVASRRLAAHPSRTRRPLSPFLSLSATPQLPPAQPLSTSVAQNGSGDTRRHQATRDSTPRRGREPFATSGVPRPASFPVAKGSRPPQRIHHRQAQRRLVQSKKTSRKRPSRSPCRHPPRQRRRGAERL